jgi:hypothetical protein
MDSIRSILPKVLRKRGLEGHATSTHVAFRAQGWLEEHLPQFHGKISVAEFSHAILRVSCSNGIVAQECRSLLSDLHSFLESEFPAVHVEQIQFLRG